MYYNDTMDSLKHKIIIGLVGEMGSGKDSVASYLTEKYGSQTVSFSRPLRDVLDRMLIPQSRENLIWLGHDLRERFGHNVLNNVIINEIKTSPKEFFCLANIRIPEDIIGIVDLPGFFLVHVKLDAQTRYQRITQRRENTDDHTKTWEEFLKDSELPTERRIREMAQGAQFTITNDGGIEALHAQVDELIDKIRAKIN